MTARDNTPVAASEASLRHALARDEFLVLFQPFFNVATGVTQGYEALVRWGRPDQDVVRPSEFLPIAGQSDLICDIDTWVLNSALTDLAHWNTTVGMRDRILSINLSGRHVGQSRLVDDVRIALLHTGVGAERLLVDVAEPVLLGDHQTTVYLQQLRDLGVAVCLDDFGTSEDSIAQLADLPVDIVKIDPVHLDVRDAETRTRLRRMVEAPQDLGLPVIVEGVESDEQLAVVRDLGCEWAQGYFLGLPMTAVEVENTERCYQAAS